VPKRVEAVASVALVAGGWRHTLAADREGRLYAAGWNKFGQCGVGHNDDVVQPSTVEALAGRRVVQLKSGWKHTLAVTEDGRFFSWGRNVNGQVSGGGAVAQGIAGLPCTGSGMLLEWCETRVLLACWAPAAGPQRRAGQQRARGAAGAQPRQHGRPGLHAGRAAR
jgi:hypothetical protein